jgi:DNA-binding phage protein
MKLKNFHETFKSDFQDSQFVIDYLQDCFEEGGIILFISALKDIVKIRQDLLQNSGKHFEKDKLLSQFLEHRNPSFSDVYQVLKMLELDLKVQLLPSTSAVA